MIIEKLNLSRLDTAVLSMFLLPFSLLSISLIMNWIANPPLRTVPRSQHTIHNRLRGTVNLHSWPFLMYAYAYVSDSMNFRPVAIKVLLIMLPVAGSLTLFSGVQILLFFLKSKLPQYDALVNFSIGAFLLVCAAFTVVAAFGFSSFVLFRLVNWLRKSIPMRVERESIHLTPFLQGFVTVHPIMFAFYAGVSVVGLVAFYVLWAITVVITSPLQDFWQEPFILGWLLSIVPLAVFLTRVRRLNRAFARSFEEQSKIAEE